MAFPKRSNIQKQTRKQLIVIGSKNPVKIACTEEAFQSAFGGDFLVQGLNVDSAVSAQPFGDEETYTGAYNRAYNCKNIFPEADYWIGIEGGVDKIGEEMTAFAWVVILDGSGKMGRAKTASFFLPSAVAELLRGGMELGHADDQVFRSSNSKHQGGAVGILTKGVVSRKELYKQSVLLALIPFINDEFY